MTNKKLAWDLAKFAFDTDPYGAAGCTGTVKELADINLEGLKTLRSINFILDWLHDYIDDADTAAAAAGLIDRITDVKRNLHRNVFGRLEYRVRRADGVSFYVERSRCEKYTIDRFDPHSCCVNRAARYDDGFIWWNIEPFDSFIQAVAYLKKHANDLI